MESAGHVLLVLAKFLILAGFGFLAWAAVVRFAWRTPPGDSAWPSGPTSAAIFLILLAVAFYVASKLFVFAGRRLRGRDTNPS